MEHQEKVTYQIVIKRITESYHRVVEVMYVLKDGSQADAMDPISYYKWDNLNDREKEKYERVQISNGEKKIQSEVKELFEQSFDELDVKKIASFLNS